MRVELVVPRKVEAGTPVPMAVRIGNTSKRQLELHFQGRSITFDLAVRRHDSVVWRRLEGTAAPAILQIRMLAPGEVLELKDVWRQKDNGGGDVGPGEYSVTATIPTDAAPIRAGPVPLTVEG